MPESILLVDDDPVLRKTLRKIIEAEADDVLLAENLAEARSMLLSNTVAVAFCDLMLPDGSGLDFLRFSKKQDPPPEVIIITGGARFDSVVQAIQLGACHYLEKPVAPARVREVLRYGLDRWRAGSIEARNADQPGRALVLDDSHLELTLFNNLLSGLGCSAFLATSYEQAVQLLRAQRFDLILSDVVLQEESGLDFLRLAQAEHPEVPVIMVTASQGIETAISALRGGAFDFLTKPIQREIFESTIMRARELSRARQERGRLERENEGHRRRLEKLSEDLNRRVQAAVEEVSRLQKFSEMILRSFPMAIVTTDRALRITQANPAVLRYLGVSQESLDLRNAQEIFGLRPFAAVLREVCDRGVRITKRSATVDDLSLGRITISYGCGPLQDDRGSIQGAILYFTDISSIQQLDDLESDQTELVVENVAASIAHEINNPLTVAIGMAELLEHESSLDTGCRKLLDSLIKALDRCTRTLREKVEMSERPSRETRRLDLHECVLKVVDFFELKLLDARVRLRTEFSSRSPEIDTWGSEIEQVLINLIKNSRDAMPDGGEIAISTLDREGEIRLEVRDTGSGMPPEDIPRLLLPHVTTKPPGKGSGLGLSICQSIVRRHRGRMEITSEPGAGTVVTIIMPRPAAPRTPGVEPSPAGSIPPDIKVVVIDDEPEIRQYCETILARHGLTPRTYSGPTEALDALSREPADLCILDIVMPQADGFKVRRMLLERYPDLRIVFMTGFSRAALSGQGLDAAPPQILRKPFKEEDFIRAISRAVHVPA